MFLHLLWSRRVGYLWTAYTEQSVEAFFGLKAGQTDNDDVQIVALLLGLLKLGEIGALQSKFPPSSMVDIMA